VRLVRMVRIGCCLLVLAAAGALVVGPSRGAKPIPAKELVRGRVLFQTGVSEGCGFCHTLAAAKTVSVIGPNLDGEMRELDQKHLSNEQLSRYVRGWIERGECLNPADATRCMPSKLFTGADADAVANFVAVCGRMPSYPGCKPTKPRLSAAAARGEFLFQTRACVSCHFSAGGPSAGPPLIGVAGAKVTLSNGAVVTASSAYLADSIANPDRQIVKGYARGVMNAIVGQENLTRAEIASLVAYIETLKPR
jgi:mono/diheme cytochrome c family protein